VIWLVASILLLFALLAVCTIAGLTTMGSPVDLAIEAATFEVVVGAAIVKLMYDSGRRR
jgi:hypothetical protein